MDNQINDTFDRITTLFVQELRSRLGSHLKEAILFGSKARGDDAPDSDYDFMVILDILSTASKDTIDDVAGKFLFEYNVVFSVFPILEERYRKQNYNPFLMNVKKEGIPL
jgi:predicted nucleotidyltransferase